MQEQNLEIQKLKATVFDILERIELHQLEIQKLDEARKNVVGRIKELRESEDKESVEKDAEKKIKKA